MSIRLIILTMAALVGPIYSADQQQEAVQRVSAASEVLQEIMAAPDQGIPDWVLERAHCAVIVPGMKQGGLIASNSSSMGPGLLGAYFKEGGGRLEDFL